MQTLHRLVAQDASDTVQSAVASGAGADSLLQYRATAHATARGLCKQTDVEPCSFPVADRRSLSLPMPVSTPSPFASFRRVAARP